MTAAETPVDIDGIAALTPLVTADRISEVSIVGDCNTTTLVFISLVSCCIPWVFPATSVIFVIVAPVFP